MGPAVLVGVLAAAPARALEPGVDVAWAAPGDCPTSADLQGRVTTRIRGAAAVRARGRVEHDGATWRLALAIETADTQGERTLEAASCESLASSAAVVIAMAIAPPRDEPAPVVAAPASSPSPPDRPAAPQRRPTPRFHVRGDVVADAGMMPSLAAGGGLSLGVWAARRLSVEASTSVFASQDGTVAGSTRGASFTLVSGGVRACWALTEGIEVAPCAGVVVERLGASGFGALRVSDASSVTWGPEALLTLAVPLVGPVHLRGGVGVDVPISRQSFVINAAGTVHRPAAVVPRGWLGPEVRF
jgi:hypothetical protein